MEFECDACGIKVHHDPVKKDQQCHLVGICMKSKANDFYYVIHVVPQLYL